MSLILEAQMVHDNQIITVIVDINYFSNLYHSTTVTSLNCYGMAKSSNILILAILLCHSLFMLSLFYCKIVVLISPYHTLLLCCSFFSTRQWVIHPYTTILQVPFNFKISLSWGGGLYSFIPPYHTLTFALQIVDFGILGYIT